METLHSGFDHPPVGPAPHPDSSGRPVTHPLPGELDGEGMLDPTSLDFWRNLHANLTGFISKNYPFSDFLKNFDSEKGKVGRTHSNGDTNATYAYLNAIYKQRSFSHPGHPTLEQHIVSQFTPPTDDPDFAEIVEETRSLIRQRFPEHQLPRTTSLVKLQDPEFWSEFEDELSKTPSSSIFADFLKGGGGLSEDGSQMQGKYHDVWLDIYDPRGRTEFRNAYKEQTGRDIDTDSARDAQRIFFEVAPARIKAQLIKRYPRIFSGFAVEWVGNSQLPKAAQAVINTLGWLGEDNRKKILDVLSKYVHIETSSTSGFDFSAEDTSIILGQAAEQSEVVAAEVGPPTLETIIRDATNTFQLVEQEKLDNGNSENEQLSSELTAALETSYLYPTLRNVLYKPFALFWSKYLETHGGSSVPEDEMRSFLDTYAHNEIAQTSLSPEEQQMLERLKKNVFSTIFSEFIEIANYSSQINHFRERSIDGKAKHLFFHQVEGIKHLVEKGAGILADEPGTGKTVTLALAALNRVDQKFREPGKIARVLVVGSKTVNNNWEEELEMHVAPGDVDTVNFNSDELAQLSQAKRLEIMAQRLKNPTADRQVLLVNYDLFRNSFFQELLHSAGIDCTIIDEAHNVKSRFMDSIAEHNDDTSHNARLAKRTTNLYRFLLSNPNMDVYLGTSTPFVKELIEPLIMGHLVDRWSLPIDRVSALREDPAGANLALREVMIRRRKDAISDIPPKDTDFIPVDLSLLSAAERSELVSLGLDIERADESSFRRFFSMLSIEAQAKMPWLIEKINELTSDGRKVVVFTPFVNDQERLTASISTKAIAKRLIDSGITSVGVLDGTLSESEKLAVQRDFHDPNGVRVLVGNYQTAGESITLNSPFNRATEVIILVAPNTISRYIQAIDRVHRIGQDEKVTIHVPFLTEDPIARPDGTYDRRIVSRMLRELSLFNAVVDGLFFVEAADYYDEIRRGKNGNSEPRTALESGQTVRLDTEQKPPAATKKRGLTRDVFDQNTDGAIVLPTSREVNLNSIGINHTRHHQIDREEALAITDYFDSVSQYPLLTVEQERIAFRYLTEGKSVAQLRDDGAFLAANPRSTAKMLAVLSDSRSVRDVLVACNLRLVASIANRYKGRLPYTDLLQEGNIGLIKGIDDFDPERGLKLSTYATWWIKQSIRRAIANTSRTIDLPVHMHEMVTKMVRVSNEFFSKHQRYPSIEELVSEGFTISQVNTAMRIARLGISNPSSLDRTIDDDGETTIGSFVSDEGDLEEETIAAMEEAEQSHIVGRALLSLSEREQLVLTLRFGLDGSGTRTLEQVGKEIGVTRERARQIEVSALKRLRVNTGLREAYDGDSPSLLWSREVLPTNVLPLRPGPIDIERVSAISQAQEVERLEEEKNSLEFGRQVVEQIKMVPDIWNALTDREKTLLTLYFKGTFDHNTTKSRLSKIFGITEQELSVYIEYSVASLAKHVGMTSSELPS